MGDQNTVVESSPEVLGGVPVFAGTRVPVQTLIDYLEGGERLDDFIEDFPAVSRGQAIAALEIARKTLLAYAHPPR